MAVDTLGYSFTVAQTAEEKGAEIEQLTKMLKKTDEKLAGPKKNCKETQDQRKAIASSLIKLALS